MITPQLPPIYRDRRRLLVHSVDVVRWRAMKHFLKFEGKELMSSLNTFVPNAIRLSPFGLSLSRPMPTVLPALVLLVCLAGTGAVYAQSRYSYSPDGAEVIDTKTGLVWQRCALGQSWSVSTCTGTASTYTHEQALVTAQNAGDTWRLPNVKELASIVDSSRFNPAIDPTAFPATPGSWFWSSTPYVGNASGAWGIDFGKGFVDYTIRSWTGRVRLVR